MKKEDEIIIEHLDFPLQIQKRPGMYIGSLDNADTLLREIIDNSEDEISAGYGNSIIIYNNFEGYNYVSDCSRGIPIRLNDKGITDALYSITSLNTGSKFKTTDTARVGQNGVGSSAVNALSEVYILMSRITADNYNTSTKAVYELWTKSGPRSKKDLFYIAICEKGYLKFEGAMRLVDIEKMLKLKRPIPRGQSTIVMFKPDPTVFDNPKAEIPVVNLQYFILIQEKFYNRKVEILVNDSPLSGNFKPYKFELLKRIIPKDTSKNNHVDIYLTFEYDPGLVGKTIYGSVNGLQVNTGVHIRTIESCIKTAMKEVYKIKHDYILNGLRACTVFIAGEVVFSEQIKSNLQSISKVKITDYVDLTKEIMKIIRKNPDYFDDIKAKLDYLAESMKSVGAIEKAQNIIDNASGNGIYRNKANMVKGFADATAGPKDRWECSMFLTEGLSPAGSLIGARKAEDVKKCAILPLRGKVLDVSDCDADKMMDNKEFFTIFSMMGVGISANSVIKDCGSPEEAYEVLKKKARYGKLIIATDSDVDGLAIQKGILYCILKFARFLIDFGMVYICESPIFKQVLKGGEIKYYYPSDPDIPGTGGFKQGMDMKATTYRFKGLGSLNKGDVYRSFFDENTRRLIRVTPEYADYAMSLVESVENRRNLLINEGTITNPYNFKDL